VLRCKFRADDKPDTSCFFVLYGTEKEAITKEINEFNNSSWKGYGNKCILASINKGPSLHNNLIVFRLTTFMTMIMHVPCRN
jgi:hypothetical protein